MVKPFPAFRLPASLHPALLLLLGLLLPGPGYAQAAFSLEVDLGARVEPLKRIIDFYCSDIAMDTAYGILDLKPRYSSNCYDNLSMNWEKRMKALNVIPITNIGNYVRTAAQARNSARTTRAAGVRHLYHTTEPNRTWGPRLNGQDPWLKTTTWQNYIETADTVWKAVKEEDSSNIVIAPGLTGDQTKDPNWFTHLFQFIDHMGKKKRIIDYLAFNPPWDPQQVRQVSGLAKGMAAQYPELGLKGIALLEYPYLVNGTALHVRFFATFEESWNMLFASKSHFRQNWSNTGLVNDKGAKLPVYWTFHKYARMKGQRLASRHSSDFKLAALASYEPAEKKLYGLFANDTERDSTVTVALQNASGKAQAVISVFDSTGARVLRELPLETGAGRVMQLPLGTVPKGEAYYVEVTFEETQTVRLKNDTPRFPAGAGLSGASPRAGALRIDFGSSAPLFRFADPASRLPRALDGRALKLPAR